MGKVLSGIRIIEIATWVFVPAAGAMLADLGADVIKIEHPVTGDPMRSRKTKSIPPSKDDKPQRNLTLELYNRGKRSVGISLTSPEGREIFYNLVETADVLITNFLPSVRRKLGIDVEQVRARNPRLIYVRGSGFGPKGPDADTPAYDGTSFWARASAAHSLRPPEADEPLWGTSGFGDLYSAAVLSGAVMGGLYDRDRTGQARTIDVSLMSVGMWAMSPSITGTAMFGVPDMPRIDPHANGNPVVSQYRTSDGRWVTLAMMQSDRYFRPLCEALGVPEWADDRRFADHASRDRNFAACVELFEDYFGRHTLAELVEMLARQPGPWGVNQTPAEVHADPQALANGYFSKVADEQAPFLVVAAPMQFDETEVGDVTPAPQHGQHTDEILAELGFDYDTILARKISGAIL